MNEDIDCNKEEESSSDSSSLSDEIKEQNQNAQLNKKQIKVEVPPPPKAEHWISGEIGSRNALLIFRSCALATQSFLLPDQHPSGYGNINRKMPAAKLHCTYKLQNSETKLITRLLDAHGLTEVSKPHIRIIHYQVRERIYRSCAF